MKNLIFFTILVAIQGMLGTYILLMPTKWGSFPNLVGNALFHIRPVVLVIGAVLIFIYLRKTDLKLYLVPLSILPIMVANFLLVQFGDLGFGGVVLAFDIFFIQLPLLVLTLIASVIIGNQKIKARENFNRKGAYK